MNPNQLPVVALTLGDPAGIGPELIARLLARARDRRSRPTSCWSATPGCGRTASASPALRVATDAGRSPGRGARPRRHRARRPSSRSTPCARSRCTRPGRGGRRRARCCRCWTAAWTRRWRGEVDAICFAPLNKHAMKLGGLKHEDELHHFAEYLGVNGYFCEFNTLGGLWTSRISSHVPLKDVAEATSTQRAHRRRRDADLPLAAGQRRRAAARRGGRLQPAQRRRRHLRPRGDRHHRAGGARAATRSGLPVAGPFPADTIFLKARDGELRRDRHHVPRPGPDRDQADGLQPGRHGAGRPADPDHDAGPRHRLRHRRPGQGQRRRHRQRLRDRLPHGPRTVAPSSRSSPPSIERHHHEDHQSVRARVFEWKGKTVPPQGNFCSNAMDLLYSPQETMSTFRFHGWTVVEVETDDGIVGLGNVALAPRIAKQIIDQYLAPLVDRPGPVGLRVPEPAHVPRDPRLGPQGRRHGGDLGGRHRASGTCWARASASRCSSCSAGARRRRSPATTPSSTAPT